MTCYGSGSFVIYRYGADAKCSVLNLVAGMYCTLTPSNLISRGIVLRSVGTVLWSGLIALRYKVTALRSIVSFFVFGLGYC